MTAPVQGAAIGLVISALFLAGCDGQPAQPAASPPVSSARPLQASTVEVSRVEPPKPEHNYAMSEDGEYGYERALSEDDVKAGRATSALLMVRYLGQSKGVQSIKIVDGNRAGVMSCSAPCRFVKTRYYVAGELLKTETVPVTDGSLIQAVMDDAFGGKLQPYAKRTN
ncbi:hypothetical protein [Caballeronia ptereochthonis]|uniref:Lipoprotein n=1 Tax=Caballeronia ptereochthonis TaxID=1777144 RepID=A0A158E525_9BURK|nr:hypothetical protein [Caballeronia ptereochthonis]SAL01975.1 lipoprotein [Caballeronia ptereochthonis]